MIERIAAAADNLAPLADRESAPRKLRALGIQAYRQVFFKPYRIIYRALDRRCVIYLIADGRRDIQPLLTRRLLG